MRHVARWKCDIKMGMLVVMMAGFALLVPQMVLSVESIVFGAVWMMIAMMGAISVWHQRKAMRRRAMRREVYTLKKKLRTSEKEARSRITVRLKA